MHLGGIDSGHESDAHQVTGCMHSHTHYHEGKVGSSGNINSRMAQMQMQQQQQDALDSLSDWFQRAIRGGKSLFKGIWGTNETDAAGAAGDKGGRGQVMPQMGDAGQTGNVHGTVNTHSAEQNAAVHSNPYFSTLAERNAAHMTPFQRLRVKVAARAEKLSEKLPGKAFHFQTKNSFHAGPQQHSRENLRKRSKFKKDELEIDCVLTDESYLMDSYDRKGEYRQLTTKN